MPRRYQLITVASAIAFVCVLSFGLFAITPAPVLAIGEVTATPTSAPTLTFEEYVIQGIEDIQNGDFNAAVDSLTNALALEEDADVYYARAYAYSQLENYQAAIDDYGSVIEFRAYDWDAYSSRGFLYAEMGDIESAMADYNEALFRNPRYEITFMNISDLYNTMGNDDEAAIMMSVARGLDAYSIGDAESALQNFDIAVSEMNSIEGGILSDVQQASVFYDRGLTYHGLEDWENALADYTSSLDAMEDMQDSYLARGIVYTQMNEMENAGSDFVNRMELIELERFDEGTLDFGDTVEVEMHYGYVYVYTFEGAEGQIVDISADDEYIVGVDPPIALLDADGNPLAGDDDFGGSYNSGLVDYALPYTGTYTLYVSHANGAFDGIISVTIEEYIPEGSF